MSATGRGFSSRADERGRFGEYGGRYVPETLIAALDELTEAYPRVTRSPEFVAELDDLLASYAGRPTPLFFARRMTDDLGGAAIYLKREDLAHTGAHKINNVLGPVPARAPHGQAARDRRDRRGPARRRDRHRGGAARPALRRLHGRRGRRAPGAQRVPDGAARRRGAPGGERLADAQGRHQRGAARLGHERARHLLLHRLGDGAAPVSDDRARLPARDRDRGARADPRPPRAGCPMRSSRAWAAARTRWASSIRSSPTPACG